MDTSQSGFLEYGDSVKLLTRPLNSSNRVRATDPVRSSARSLCRRRWYRSAPSDLSMPAMVGIVPLEKARVLSSRATAFGDSVGVLVSRRAGPEWRDHEQCTG
jgi:hypothetical protein